MYKSKSVFLVEIYDKKTGAHLNRNFVFEEEIKAVEFCQSNSDNNFQYIYSKKEVY